MDSVMLLNTSAIALTVANRPFEAIELFEKALVQEPENHLLWLNIGIAQKNSGDYVACEASYKKAIALYHACPDTWAALGLVQYELGRLEEAEVSYQQALVYGGKTASFFNNYGVLRFSLGDYEEARTFFEQALALDPTYNEALYNLRDTCVELEDMVAATEIGRVLRDLQG